VKGAWKVIPGLLAVLVVHGCTGRFEYVGPSAVTTSAIVDRSADEVWRAISSALDGGPFAVVGLDKDSGVLTLGYSGDPERFVDCGQIVSTVTNLRGTRTYTFPAATAAAEYELMTGKEILVVARRMTVEIRLTATVSRVETRRTRVATSGRYVLTRTMTTRDAQDRERTASHAIHFGSEHGAAFPGPVTCRASGALEAEVLLAAAK
jgi:hypothetical protein